MQRVADRDRRGAECNLQSVMLDRRRSGIDPRSGHVSEPGEGPSVPSDSDMRSPTVVMAVSRIGLDGTLLRSDLVSVGGGVGVVEIDGGIKFAEGRRPLGSERYDPHFEHVDSVLIEQGRVLSNAGEGTEREERIPVDGDRRRGGEGNRHVSSENGAQLGDEITEGQGGPGRKGVEHCGKRCGRTRGSLRSSSRRFDIARGFGHGDVQSERK